MRFAPTNSIRCDRHRPRSRAFSLVELLVVISIIALLVAVLVPGLRGARRAAKNVVCQSRLHALMAGIQAYAADNGGCVVPSYNMRGVIGSASNPFDGWGPILDRDGIILGSDQLKDNPFTCPNTRDIRGVPFGRAGLPEGHAEGYMDWPAVVTIFGDFPRSLPTLGFDHIVRVSYWINGDNPNGYPKDFIPGVHFTGSVGYGPSPSGLTMTANRFDQFQRPGQLVALSDGFYTGNQEATRPDEETRRIGYRHERSGEPIANVAFADGHAAAVPGDVFPRKFDEQITLEEARTDNLGSGPTLYAHPKRDLEETR